MSSGDERVGVRDLWNEFAVRNHHVAIYDTPAVRDPESREEAFRAAGEVDARLLAWFTTPDMRVLDLGCGSGRVTLPMAARVREVLGVDVSDEMLARARAYVRAPNATFLRTDGKSLAGIATASVDFAYSLLCLIHVDKRSAFHYLRELARVLVPGGLAHLQFQTLAHADGIAKFLEGLEQEMPLEFYGPDELPPFLSAAGLEPIGMHRAAEYCFVTVVNGSAERWLDSWRESFEIAEVRLEGFLREPTSASRGSAALNASVRSRAAEARPLLATFRLRRPERTIALEAPLVVPPRSHNQIRFEIDGLGEHARARLSWNGAEPAGSRAWVEPSAPGLVQPSLDAGLLPPGQPWCAETIARFPGLLVSRTLASR